MKTSPLLLCLLTAVILAGFARPAAPAAEEGLAEKTKEVIRETSTAVEEAGIAAADSIKNLWLKIDAARLKNRTPDQLVAWVIMGVLVGSLAGMLSAIKPEGFGKVGRLLLGLAGAFIGGIVVHLYPFDFGWGPVLIRYEELFFAFVGAILLIVIGRVYRVMANKKKHAE